MRLCLRQRSVTLRERRFTATRAASTWGKAGQTPASTPTIRSASMRRTGRMMVVCRPSSTTRAAPVTSNRSPAMSSTQRRPSMSLLPSSSRARQASDSLSRILVMTISEGLYHSAPHLEVANAYKLWTRIRSTAPSSLSIWTHYLNDMKLNSSFAPEACPKAPAGLAVTVGSGAQMGNLYAYLAKQNFMVVGGADPNVGLGGWLTGGGHSPLSGKYGLGPDNVVQLELVTPRGEVVTANECKNPDLFFAMRGVGVPLSPQATLSRAVITYDVFRAVGPPLAFFCPRQ